MNTPIKHRHRGERRHRRPGRLCPTVGSTMSENISRVEYRRKLTALDDEAVRTEIDKRLSQFRSALPITDEGDMCVARSAVRDLLDLLTEIDRRTKERAS